MNPKEVETVFCFCFLKHVVILIYTQAKFQPTINVGE